MKWDGYCGYLQLSQHGSDGLDSLLHCSTYSSPSPVRIHRNQLAATPAKRKSPPGYLQAGSSTSTAN